MALAHFPKGETPEVCACFFWVSKCALKGSAPAVEELPNSVELGALLDKPFCWMCSLKGSATELSAGMALTGSWVG